MKNADKPSDEIATRLRAAETELLRLREELQLAHVRLEETEDREGKLRVIFDNIPSIIYLKDRDGRHLLVNREFGRVLQLPPQDLLGKTVADFFPQDIAAALTAHDNEVLQHGEVMTFDEVIPLDHDQRAYASLKFPLRDATGAIYGLGGISIDITEQKAAEEALRQSEELLRICIEHAPAAVAMFDNEMRYLAVSHRWLTDYRLGEENIIGKSHYAVFPEIGEEWKAIHRRCLNGACARREEDPFPRADGTLDWVRWEIVPWYMSDGRVGGIIMFTEVITERKRAEAKLQGMNRALRMISSVNEALIRAEGETTLLDHVCTIAVEIGGYRMAWVGIAENDVERTVRPVAHAGYEQGYLTEKRFSWGDNTYGQGPVGIAMRTRQPVYFDDLRAEPRFAVWRDAALQRGYESLIALPLTTEEDLLGVLVLYTTERYVFTGEEVQLLMQLAGDLAYGIATLRLRVARRQAEASLRRSEAQYRRIVETAREGILMLDNTMRATYANQRMADMLGYTIEDMLTKSLFDFIAPELHADMQRRIEQRRRGVQEVYEFRLRRRDGSDLWALISGTPLFDDEGNFTGILGMLTDVTERHHAATYQREFARRTIEAATEGKLLISDRESIRHLAGPPLASWEIRTVDDLQRIRHVVATRVRAAGMAEERVDDFILCISEAATNACKHACGGICSLHRPAEDFLAVIADQGPGILVADLPELALKRGFTTGVSLGMGYKAMIALADNVYLATGTDGTVVGIKMALNAPPPPPDTFPGMDEDW